MEFIDNFDIARGVAEIVVDSARRFAVSALHFATRQIQHEVPSTHFVEPSKPNPIHLNRWEDLEYLEAMDILQKD